MPQYFGIPNPLFDLTVVRICIIILLVFITFDFSRLRGFIDCIVSEKFSLVLLPYIFVLIYTMVVRTDLNTLLNPAIEILELYLLIYIIKDSLGIRKAVNLTLAFMYILILLGFVEIIMEKSPFSYLETIKGTYTGGFVRGDSYRIMSSCIHSIGYGMLLVSSLPFVGLDFDGKSYNVFYRPFLLLGYIVNIFSTGSRSSLGIMFVELLVMLILSDKKYLRKNIFILIISTTGFIVLVFLLQGTSFGKYILLQITSTLDSVFGTQMSLKYGAEGVLAESASYRKLLLKVFSVGWLNPLVGIGRSRGFRTEIDGLLVESIDNYYVAEYIRYAYPGMISYIFFLLYFIFNSVKDVYKTRSALIRAVLIGIVSYCLHLYIADSLQTLKYLYVLFAIYVCCDKTEYIPENKGKYFRKKESKYVRK